MSLVEDTGPEPPAVIPESKPLSRELSPTKPRHQKRIEGLDALRGFAALGVLLWHFQGVTYGAYGVHLFFVISGFVIFMTVEKTRRPVDFVISRFSRLYPTFWLSLTFCFLLSCFYNRPDLPPEFSVRLGRFLVSLTMIPGWLSTPYFVGIYWTLEVEMTFYVIMFFLLWTRRLDQVFVVLLTLIALGAIMGLLHPWVHHRAIERFRRMASLDFLHVLTIGVFLYRFRVHPKPAYVAIIILLAFTPFTQYRPGQRPLYDTLVTLGFALLVYLATTDRLPWLKHKVLVYFGTISYALYLTHDSVGQIIMRKVLEAGYRGSIAFAVAVALALGLATVITYAFDKPMMTSLRRRLERWVTPDARKEIAGVSQGQP